MFLCGLRCRFLCWGGRIVQATACRAVIYGFNSHPQLQTWSSVPKQNIISLKGIATNPKRIEIHEFEKIFTTTLKRLNESTDIDPKDKNEINDFINHLLAKNLSKGRVIKYTTHLIVLARLAITSAGKSLGNLDRKDIESMVAKINSADYSPYTNHDYKIVLRKYFQWLKGYNEDEHQFPEEVRWIKPAYKKLGLLPEALITEEELRKLAEAAENLRDRALILVHYDGGLRIGETLSLNRRHVTFDKHGALLIVDGKTGTRRVRIIASVPALAEWMSVHPCRDDPDSALWVGIGTTGRNKPLLYNGARMMLKRLVKKAGLNKRVYTHLMRHSRATELANHLTESQMDSFLGWVQGSKRTATYVHLSGRDVDNALLEMNGIKPDENERKPLALRLVKCPRCGKDIGSNAQYCPSCGMLLDQKTAMLYEEERTRADEIMDKLMQDEEVKSIMAMKIAQLYSSAQLHPTYPKPT